MLSRCFVSAALHGSIARRRPGVQRTHENVPGGEGSGERGPNRGAGVSSWARAQMAMKRVAVTGGSGRVGEHIVKALLDHGHHVINVDRRQADKPLAKMIYCDLRQRELVQPILDQVDAVIHLAEIPHISMPYSPDYIFAHNTAATSC